MKKVNVHGSMKRLIIDNSSIDNIILVNNIGKLEKE